jgi:flagellar hook-associated protein 3 FlgL
MSLRITQTMLYARSLFDVRRSSQGILRIQEQVSSGRRINRPSDDPSAMVRLLPLNSELANLKGLTDNAAAARETLDTGASALLEGSTALSRLKELLVQAANGTVSPSDRKSIGFEIDQLMQHMLGLANTKRGDDYLFGGTRTDQPPFRIVDNAGGTRVVYDGSNEDHEIKVAPGLTTKLYSSGRSFFQDIDRQPASITGNTGAAATGFADTGRGFASLEVAFDSLLTSSLPAGITAGASISTSTAVGNLGYTYNAGAGTLSVAGGPAVSVPATDGAFATGNGGVVFLDVTAPITPATGTLVGQANLSTDGGATQTLVDFAAGNAQVINSYDDTVLNVDVTNLNRIGTDAVTFHGTFDVFTAMIEARDALANTSNLSSDQVKDRLRQLIGEVTTAHDAVLTGVQELGIRSGNLDRLLYRVEELILSDEKTRSNIQDADLAEAISEMTRKQFNFEASLQVSARIVQTSLLTFLR